MFRDSFVWLFIMLLPTLVRSAVTFSKKKMYNAACVMCFESDCHSLSNDILGIIVEVEIASQWQFRCLKQSDSTFEEIYEGYVTITNHDQAYELGDNILSQYQHLKIEANASEVEIINLVHPKL